MTSQLRALMTLLALYAAAALSADQCITTIRAPYCCVDAVQLKWSPNSATAPWPNAIGDAATNWNTDCTGAGEFYPEFTTLPGPGKTINITYIDGTSGSTKCGEFVPPSAINLWRFAVRNGSTFNCVSSQEGFTDNLTHEVGHWLGLGHPTPDGACPSYIMANYNLGVDRYIHEDECMKVMDENVTTQEQYGSPIVINLDNGPYELTGVADPVVFDLNNDGVGELTTWTAGGTNQGFLYYDRNGDGVVNSGAELFGNYTPRSDGSIATNGFEALKDFDSNGDSVIDPTDILWPQLRLWIDRNHNGVSEADEIQSLDEAGIVAISLDYRVSPRHDEYGNLFRFASTIRVHQGGGVATRKIFDVLLLNLSQ